MVVSVHVCMGVRMGMSVGWMDGTLVIPFGS